MLNEEVECWIEVFKEYVEAQNLAFPIQAPARFKALLNNWASETTEGQLCKSNYTIGFIDDELKYMQFYATSIGNNRDSYEQKNPHYEAWEAYFEDYRSQAP